MKEKEDMIVWAKEIGADSIYFKSLSMGSHTTKEIKDKWSFLLPKEDKFKRKQFNFDYPICNILLISLLCIGMVILDCVVLIIVMILRYQILEKMVM